nr:cell envelope integrity protein TolA [uncultured Desulfobulbus sp.]
MRYTEIEFLLHQQEEDGRWGLAIGLAVCVHLAIVLTLFFSPSLFTTKPIVEEVVSVSLVTLPEAGGSGGAPSPPAAAKPAKPAKPAATQPSSPPPPPKAVEPPKPVAPPEPVSPPPTPKEKVAVKPEPAPEPAPEPVSIAEPIQAKNPISLAPTKRKVKKAQDTRLDEEKVKIRKQEEQEQRNKEELAQRKKEEQELQKKIEERKRLADARKLEEQELQKKLEERKREAERKKAQTKARLDQIRAENEARAAAAEARELAAQANAAAAALASAREAVGRQNAAMEGALNKSGSGGRAAAQNIVGQSYINSVLARIKGYWKLPDTRLWDSSLYANVVITLNRQGGLVSIRFDRRSGDPQFDQMVEKTIHRAIPMPAFPALMTGDTVEVGGNFNVRELAKMR